MGDIVMWLDCIGKRGFSSRPVQNSTSDTNVCFADDDDDNGDCDASKACVSDAAPGRGGSVGSRLSPKNERTNERIVLL